MLRPLAWMIVGFLACLSEVVSGVYLARAGDPVIALAGYGHVGIGLLGLVGITLTALMLFGARKRRDQE